MFKTTLSDCWLMYPLIAGDGQQDCLKGKMNKLTFIGFWEWLFATWFTIFCICAFSFSVHHSMEKKLYISSKNLTAVAPKAESSRWFTASGTWSTVRHEMHKNHKGEIKQMLITYIYGVLYPNRLISSTQLLLRLLKISFWIWLSNIWLSTCGESTHLNTTSCLGITWDWLSPQHN